MAIKDPSAAAGWRGEFRLLAVIAVACAAVASPAAGQMLPPVGPDQIGGMPQVRPVVPIMPPRPGEGPGGRPAWNTDRLVPESAPTAGFLESLKGSDAAIEVVVGQGRILTTREPIAAEDGEAVIAVGDPTVIEFEVLPNPRMIRLTGRRAGTTDMTIVTADDQTYIFEIHVVYDLRLLRTQLQRVFPDALIQLSQLREHVLLEGQARDVAQVAQIEQALRAFLSSVQVSSSVSGTGQPSAEPDEPAPVPPVEDDPTVSVEPTPLFTRPRARPEIGGRPSAQASFPEPQVLNLLRVPGVQQVMLQVRVAELNRTGLREIGADMYAQFGEGNIIGTSIGGATNLGIQPTGLGLGASTTAFGIFPSGHLEIMLRALRQNSVLSVLAEPNLMAMDGHQASFLAGGEFPVPIQQVGAGGLAGAITVEWKEFGVQLNFIPTILDDHTIRLNVAPEVSSIDEQLGVTLAEGVQPIPAISTRRVQTTVQLREGQTLVLAGLLLVEMDAQTQRIPGLGDLPYIGPLFSNTTHQRQEKELLVMVTPFMVSPLEAHQVPCLPGADIDDPNDLEFYLLNRIEGRRGREFRTTTMWDDPWKLVPLLHLERDHCYGPAGFSQ